MDSTPAFPHRAASQPGLTAIDSAAVDHAEVDHALSAHRLKSFVVTGGARGIGRAIVEAIIDAGHGAVVFDRDPAALEWAANRPAYERIRGVSGDAGDPDDCRRAAGVAAELGELSGWINNAAVFRDHFLHESPQQVLEAIDANLRLAIVGTSVAVEWLRSSGFGGSIVNISSHQGSRAVPGALAYATAKAGIEGLTRATAVDYGADDIRANALALGTIYTERLAAELEAMDADERELRLADLTALHPLGRIGSPTDVAAAVMYLLSDEASFVSGAIIPVDGGRSSLGLDPEARLPRSTLSRV